MLIYGSLRTPTLDRFARVTHFSTMLSVVACLCMAIAGYWNFVELTKGNILNNFDQADGWINIARACVRIPGRASPLGCGLICSAHLSHSLA